MKSLLAKNLKNLMDSIGLGESALAKKIGIQQPLIHRLLSGENSNPTLNTLQIIANFFSISISQLIGEEQLAVSIDNTISGNLMNWYRIPIMTPKAILANTPLSSNHQDYVLVDHALSDKAFALAYHQTNMEPAIPEKSIIIIDPLISPTHKDFFLTNTDNDLLVKYCIKKGNAKFFLSSVNNFDTIEPFSSEDIILGTIVRVIYGRKAL